jgi:hypothetical protein
MSMLAAWVLFPLLLLATSLGLGLLLERAAGRTLPGPIVLPAGLALVLALANLITFTQVLAALALPLIAALALAGLVLGRKRLRFAGVDTWAAIAAVGVFAVFAAPALLSGEPTFSGSLMLPDTANQITLAERVAEAGPEFESLPPSSYWSTLRKYLASQYPIAAQAGLGVLAPVGLLELAWLYQPFLSFLAAMTALSLYGLLGPWIARRTLRAGLAFLAAQPALVVSFALQGSIKETAALTTFCAFVALVTYAVVQRWPARAFLPVAVVGAAMVGALGPAAAAYLVVPLLVLAIAWATRVVRHPQLSELAWGAGALLLGGVLLLPVLSGLVTAYEVSTAVLASAPADLGNLAVPLNVGQAAGVWLEGDFRYLPEDNRYLTFGLIGLAVGAAVLGLGWALRRRAAGPLLFMLTLGFVSAYLLRRGSPYADAKVLMILSPAVLLAAALGVVALAEARRRLEAGVLAAVLAGAVLGSNALAYHGVQNAPHDRYQELLEINERFAGSGGPALFSEYDEYASYLLRDLRPYSEPEHLHGYRGPPARDPNGLVDPAHRPSVKTPLDIDDLTNDYVQSLPLLVLRRSPTVSRPPANFRRVFEGRYYDVWRREQGPGATSVRAHLPLGADVFSPGGVPRCRDVRDLARRARRAGGELAYVERPALATLDPLETELPAGWFTYGAYPSAAVPVGQGVIEGSVRLPRGGRQRLWLEGSFGRGLRVTVDGRDAGAVSYEPGNAGQYLPLGELRLRPGRHTVRLIRGGGDLRPGNGAGDQSSSVHIGPLVFSPRPNERRAVRSVAAEDAGRLCGRRLDWIEVTAPGGRP